jgi:hypothetical protein
MAKMYAEIEIDVRCAIKALINRSHLELQKIEYINFWCDILERGASLSFGSKQMEGQTLN